jgi:hypothetical protein
LKLKKGDELDWSWDIHNGKMALIIQKVVNDDNTTTTESKIKKKQQSQK